MVQRALVHVSTMRRDAQTHLLPSANLVIPGLKGIYGSFFKKNSTTWRSCNQIPFIRLRSPGGSHAGPAGLYKLRRLVSFLLINGARRAYRPLSEGVESHTGICHGDSRGVNVAEGAADGGNGCEEHRAWKAEQGGGEVSRSFVCRPAEVADGCWPELRVGHGCEMSLTTGRGDFFVGRL